MSDTQPAPAPRAATPIDRLQATLSKLPRGFDTLVGGEHLIVSVNARDLVALLRQHTEAHAALRLAEAALVPELEAIVQCNSSDFDWRDGAPLPSGMDPDVMEMLQPILDALGVIRTLAPEAAPHG